MIGALAAALTAAPAYAQDARQIVQEAQRRTEASSQHYEGLLQVIDSKGKISDKRWVFDRIGSHGASRSLLTFVSPAEVKGVALLVVAGGAAYATSSNVRNAVTSSHRLERVSEGRFDLMKGGLTIWRERPVAGAGLGGFQTRFV